VNNSAVNCLYNQYLHACTLPPIRSSDIARHSRQVKHLTHFFQDSRSEGG